MADAVFLDTNVIRNVKPKRFFGNTDVLQQISKVAQIYVPSIVIDEIRWQKMEVLMEELQTLKNSHFYPMIECDANRLELHIGEHIEKLYKASKKEIKFIEKSLSPSEGHIDNLKRMAIEKKAPFEIKNDRGFKDAYIFLTVVEHHEETTDNIFLYTKDNRLSEAFNEYRRVKILSSPDNYFDHRKSYFREEYFLTKLGEHFEENRLVLASPGFSSSDVQTVEFNQDNEWVITLSLGGKVYEAKVDFYSKEITDAYSL